MSADTTTVIVDQLSAAISSRKDSLTALRERIAQVLDPIPVGVVLADDQGEVCRIIRVRTGASYYGNDRWNVTIRGTGAISTAGKLLCENLDSSRYDGHDWYYRSSEPTCRWRNGEPGDNLAYESCAMTRALAARLPAAVAKYMDHCAEEVEANNAVQSG